ncbi:MAG: hypothetical protein P4K83_10025 [Terracidiphilus sp.]|nr:hypothetical protein [Terracidiphilus sp.]
MIDTIYRCEICGEEDESPLHWIVIHCSDERLSLFRWSHEVADEPGARHYCGQEHAQVYISRWFQSYCS